MNNNFSKIRIKDIADIAGVSPGTVDRVLHNRGEVSVRTREKILSIIGEMNYQPDILASTLAYKKKVSIAALLPEVKKSNPFWNYPIQGIEDGLKEIRHFGISLDKYSFNYFDRKSFIRQSANILSNNPQGVILAPVFTEEAAIVIEKCRVQNIPVVLINANICTGNCLAFVGQDSLQSGMVAAKLMHYGLDDDSEIFIVNFIREKENQGHILKREEGFRKYYSGFTKNGTSRLRQINISETGTSGYDRGLKEEVDSSPALGGIFVTNSRVYKVAGLLEKINRSDITLIGYDLLDENRELLKRGVIDFLISQRPREQGYKSIMTLFHHLVLKNEIEKDQYLPIDIITRENLEHYTFT